MEDWPTMGSEELSSRARDFAETLATRLDEFNERNPKSKMSEEEQRRIQEQYGDNIPGLTPQQMKPAFEMVFCLYMGSRYGLVP